MATTLAELLRDERIDWDELHRRYDPVLSMVDVLIGVVPNCDRYLEIWPPGFRTYNLMVPNFLNLPASLAGLRAPKDLMGLAMYASSRAAECAYCSAHTCSFALRRGSTAEAVTGEARSETEAAVVAVAESLSTMPHHYNPESGAELRNQLGDARAEWVVMSVAMMGFLNKFMDGFGVELEASSINDVAELIEPTGWSVGQHAWAEPELEREPAKGGPPVDSLLTLLRVARKAPGAVRLDRQWHGSLPKEPAAIRTHVGEAVGWDEPLLTAMAHSKPRRALAAMLHHNLDPEQSELGIGTKALVGLVFAQHAGNEHLAERARILAGHHGVNPAALAVAEAGTDPAAATAANGGLDETTATALALARAASPSPAVVEPDLLDRVSAALTPAQAVETVVWLSVNQLLHRLTLWYRLVG